MTETVTKLEEDCRRRTPSLLGKISKIIFRGDREQRKNQRLAEAQTNMREAEAVSIRMGRAAAHAARVVRIGEFEVSEPIRTREELDVYLDGTELS